MNNLLKASRGASGPMAATSNDEAMIDDGFKRSKTVAVND